MPITSCPAASSRAAKAPPINPPAPVTSTRMKGLLQVEGGLAADQDAALVAHGAHQGRVRRGGAFAQRDGARQHKLRHVPKGGQGLAADRVPADILEFV